MRIVTAALCCMAAATSVGSSCNPAPEPPQTAPRLSGAYFSIGATMGRANWSDARWDSEFKWMGEGAASNEVRHSQFNERSVKSRVGHAPMSRMVKHLFLLLFALAAAPAVQAGTECNICTTVVGDLVGKIENRG